MPFRCKLVFKKDMYGHLSKKACRIGWHAFCLDDTYKISIGYFYKLINT